MGYIGSSKAPHGGFKGAPIEIMRGSGSTSSLPIAHTWYGIIKRNS